MSINPVKKKYNRMEKLQIRDIEHKDNAALAAIIRTTLAEFGANHPGTVYFDVTTDSLYELFQQAGAAYFVAELDGVLVGGGGIFPTDGLPGGTCELVKMYLSASARGMGLGRMMIEKCLQTAAALGYKNVYLETMPELQQALKVYEKFGFEYLTGPMGNSGHFGCTLWMLKRL
jgi:putative acetyltransferase